MELLLFVHSQATRKSTFINFVTNVEASQFLEILPKF